MKMSYAEISNCFFPNQLYYAVEDDTWLRKNEDGTITIGITDVGQTLAGTILHATPKKVGVKRERGEPITVIESSKWVGPIKSPVSGTIMRINEDIVEDASLMNKSPYNQGWLVVIEPLNLEAELADMLIGKAAVDAYRLKVEKEDIEQCDHCEGFEI